VLRNERVLRIAQKHKKTVAQIVLRWHLDSGLVAIPKSINPERIRNNFQIFDFQLDAEDIALLNELDNPKGRIGPDPDIADF